MTRHENILSFDEARARGSASSVRSSTHARSSHAIPRQNNHVAHQPQRLTYDPSFEQSFTATARSGSYASSYRGRTHSSHAQTMRSAKAPQRASSTASHRTHQPTDAAMRNRSSQEMEQARTEKKSIAHRMRSAKAERQFNKAFGADEPVKPGPEQSSRPALYEMKMGKNHKRSTRMQNTAAGKKRKGLLSRLASIFAFLDPRSPRFSSPALITCATFVLAVVLLYQPVANYYQEIRQQQQLEAEYAVVADYYSSLKSEVEYLNTKEGLEEYVRQELGWVKSGEKVATVEGLDPRDATVKKGSITSDLSDAVPTPDTWYSGVLDIIFGYNKP